MIKGIRGVIYAIHQYMVANYNKWKICQKRREGMNRWCNKTINEESSILKEKGSKQR